MMICRADIERAGYTKQQATGFITSLDKHKPYIGYVTKMGRNVKGAICSLAFFDLDLYIEIKAEQVKKCKPNSAKGSKRLLNRLIELRERLNDKNKIFNTRS